MDWLYTSDGNGFLNSNLFLAAVTVGVGFIAWKIYLSRKEDRIREAATVVLSDIKTVVSSVGTIRQDFVRNEFLIEGRYILNSDSWGKYKYLLLPNLEFEQWNALDQFFHHVDQYDSAVTINDGFFVDNASQVWVSLHSHYLRRLEELDLPDPLPDPIPVSVSIPRELVDELNYFSTMYIGNMVRAGATYSPVKPINMAKEALDSIDDNILVSSVGTQLVDLASEHKSFFKRVFQKGGKSK